MSTIQILHRFTEAVIFECEVPADLADASASRKLGYAVKQALLARANLADANLARAYLADADLAGAYLAGANLARANLARANLAGAYLAGANLARANLARANLADANLAGANLARANLADANLADANLADANLADAKNVPETNGSESIQEPAGTRAERHARRAERFREHNPDVPVIPDIDVRILGVLERQEGTLNMGNWHTCKTTHCMAGWAITLAGEKGRDLEAQHGPHRAGHMIYTASIGHAPHFFASNEQAMEGLKARAAEQVAS